jgi:hypothetical protein
VESTHKRTSVSLESKSSYENFCLSLILVQNYFSTLQKEGLFSINVLADQIALLAIYLPILRTDMHSFMQTWNIHRIRKQPNRPNAVPGKPYVLYHHPPELILNYGLSVDVELLNTLQNDVRDWGKVFVSYEIN